MVSPFGLVRRLELPRKKGAQQRLLRLLRALRRHSAAPAPTCAEAGVSSIPQGTHGFRTRTLHGMESMGMDSNPTHFVSPDEGYEYESESKAKL
jgi:hypothetical protein